MFLAPQSKYNVVLKQFDELQPGKAFYFLDEEDPGHLNLTMLAKRGNQFTWSYEEQGPERWTVLLHKNKTDDSPTIGEIAAEDIRKAEVLRKWEFDYCCGGKMTLQQACYEKGLDIIQVQKELEKALEQRPISRGHDFDKWELDFLADYIYNEHHKYFYNEDPVISSLMDKVVNQHVAKQPYLKDVAAWYIQLQIELVAHFLKEEEIIFPHIRGLVMSKKNNIPIKENGITNISGPLQMMEAEHEAAGEIIHQINSLTSNYTPPPDACSSFKLLYSKLEALEDDLHQHIHLENNILFPKAEKLETVIKQAGGYT